MKITIEQMKRVIKAKPIQASEFKISEENKRNGRIQKSIRETERVLKWRMQK